MRKLKLLITLCMVTIAASASKTLYFQPNSNWAGNTTRYSLYLFTGENAGPWLDFTATGDGTYNTTISDEQESWESMIIVAMNPNTTDNNWDNKYNQTVNLAAAPATGLLYTANNDGNNNEGWENITCTISFYGATAASFTDGGKYLFKNVATGKYMAPGSDWGTRASLIAPTHFNTIHLNNGKYKIESQVSNGGTSYYLGLNNESKMYLDNGGKELNITNIGNDTFIMSFDGESSYIGYDGSNIALAHNLALTNPSAQWKIIPYEDALKDATMEKPLDASFLVLCQNFDRNHRSAGAWTMVANNKNLCGGKNENKVAESWHSSNGFTLSQTVTVPNGYYKIRAQAAYCDADITDDSYPVVYAGEATTPFKFMTDNSGGMDAFSDRFLNGEYFTDWSDMVAVTNKSLTVGVKCARTDTWNIWDNIQLQYYGPLDLTSYKTGLADIVDEAEALEGTIPTACYNEIATVVNANNKEYETGDEYDAAIAAINTAIDTYAYENIKLAYARYQRIRTAVLAINDQIYVTAADAAANAATTNTAVDEAVPTLRNALTTAIAGTASADIDLTDALIDNASPGTAGKTDYWTNNGTVKYGSNLCELYNENDGSTRQTIPATMPIGYYKLTVVGYTRDGQTARMFVDKGSENVAYQQLVGVAKDVVNDLGQGNSWIADGNGVNEMVFNLDAAAENNFTIGIWAGDTGDKWTAWRSFKLEFLGTTVPLSVLDNDLTAYIAAARTTVNGLEVPAGVKSTFESVASGIETAKKDYTTAAEYAQATEDIDAAVEAAKAAVAPTAENARLMVKAEATANLEGLDETYKAQYSTALSYNATQLAACTTAAQIEALNANVWAAIGTAINTIQLTGDDKLDLTYLLTNPDLTNLPAWQNCDGWYSEQTDGNRQVMHTDREDVKAEDGKNCFYEYWSWAAKANDKFNLYTKLNLPEGTYTISCYAFATQQDGEAGKTPVEGVYFYANDTQGDVVANTKLAQKYISFVNDAQQEVKIGLKALSSGNTFNWMGIGYVELYKVPAQSYTINENEAWDNTVSGAGEVTLNRTIKAGVNTLVLPFSMTQAEVESTFGVGSKVYVASAYEAEQSNLKFTTHEGISANMPCLLKATEAGTSYTLADRTIVAGSPELVTNGGVTMTGTYAASITVENGNYVISNKEGEPKIYLVDSPVTLKNTRAYITLTTPGARALTMSFDDGITTGIATMENGQLNVETGVIYDLSGRVVKNPAKGIYVINGKKIVK